MSAPGSRSTPNASGKIGLSLLAMLPSEPNITVFMGITPKMSTSREGLAGEPCGLFRPAIVGAPKGELGRIPFLGRQEHRSGCPEIGLDRLQVELDAEPGFFGDLYIAVGEIGGIQTNRKTFPERQVESVMFDRQEARNRRGGVHVGHEADRRAGTM